MRPHAGDAPPAIHHSWSWLMVANRQSNKATLRMHHLTMHRHVINFIATQFWASSEQKSMKASHLNLLIRMMLDLVPRVVVFGIPGFLGKDSRRTSSFTGFHAGAAAPCRLEKWKEHHEAETYSQHFTTLLYFTYVGCSGDAKRRALALL